jgi:hypothetical protein
MVADIDRRRRDCYDPQRDPFDHRVETHMAKITGLTPAPTQTIVAGETPFAAPMANVEDFDPIDVLPSAQAREKLQKLRLRTDDLHKLVPGFEQLQELSLEKIKIEREIARLTRRQTDDGFGLSVDDGRVKAAQARLDRLTDDHKRIKELGEVRSQAWREAGSSLQAVEGWLRSQRPGTLQDYDGPEPKLAKGENGLLDAIENRRRRAIELKASLNAVRSAPFPASYAKQRLREQVEILAQRGEPNVAALVERADDGKLEFPRMLARAQVRNVPKAPAATAYCELFDAEGVIAFLLKETLIKRLDSMLDSKANDKIALSPEARAEAEARAMADLLDIERQEAALTWRAMDERLPVEFRGGISPQAILRLVTAPRPVTTAAGSSPEHAFAIVGR